MIGLFVRVLLFSAALIGYLPLVPWLERLPAIALPLAMLGGAIAWQRGIYLKERPALLLSAGFFFYYALQFNRHNVALPAANLLACLLVVRLIGEKSPRNILQSIALSLFCLAASTLFDLSSQFIFYLLLLLMILTISLVLLTFQSAAPQYNPGRTELKGIITVALLQPFCALPLIVLLFFILPRTQLPLWSGLSLAGSDRPGIADSVQPGDRSSIAKSTVAVLRVEMPKIGVEDLYWRGMVLNSLEGDKWVRREPPGRGKVIAPAGRSTTQKIYLEPGRLKYLPALDLPLMVSGSRGEPSADLLYPPSRFTVSRLSYSAASKLSATIMENSVNRQFYTRLPENLPAGIKRLSADAMTAKSDAERLQRLIDSFGRLGLSYSATDLPTGADALEKFLFSAKKGHCELFATAFATAARAVGLPARLVGGYLGGDYNELAGYYIISEERAHIWTEIWLDGTGWQRVDPSRFATNFGETIQKRKSSLLLRLQMTADTMNYYWNRAVITYDLEAQFEMARGAGERLRGLRDWQTGYRKLLKPAAVIIIAAAAVWLVRFKKRSSEERLLAAFRRRMKQRFGINVEPSMTLHEAAALADNDAARKFADIYTAAIYCDRRLTVDEIRELELLLKGIKRFA